MRTFLDCYPCFLRQVLATLRLVTDDEAEQKRILDLVMARLPTLPLAASPPEIAEVIYGLLARETGIEDPYRELKAAANRRALASLPELEALLAAAPDRLRTAVALAVAGNLMDLGVQHEGFKAAEEIAAHLPREFAIDDEPLFRRRLQTAASLLYIGDNAGEIVADRLLLAEIRRERPELELTFVVRGGPIINDVTIEDARQVGMDAIAEVIASGCRAPALLPGKMGAAVERRFRTADLVIAKGQGNYEALSQEKRPLFFLLQCKCPVVGRDLGVAVGSAVFKAHRGA
ncbi:MAG: DUF89 family protein [Deltaproteobacteria bacterium]|nr:DUF89 family protein [Deltaproteobacteria bacterium]